MMNSKGFKKIDSLNQNDFNEKSYPNEKLEILTQNFCLIISKVLSTLKISFKWLYLLLLKNNIISVWLNIIVFF